MFRVTIDSGDPIENVIGYSESTYGGFRLEFADGSLRFIKDWYDVIVERVEK